MESSGKKSKKTIYYTCSTGQQGDIKHPAIEFRVPSPWKAGKSRNKFES